MVVSALFLLLMVAALTSTISLGEVSVAYLQDHFKMKRGMACVWVMLPLTILSTLCSLSQGVLGDFRILGLNIFDFLDNTATNIMLPVAAIFTCLFVGWAAPKDFLKNELTNAGKIGVRTFPAILFIIRYAAPLLIAVILFAKILD